MCAQSEAPVMPVPHKDRKEPEKKAAEVVVAIYDFCGAEQGDLSLTKVYKHLYFFHFY